MPVRLRLRDIFRNYTGYKYKNYSVAVVCALALCACVDVKTVNPDAIEKPITSKTQARFADAHIHFNWDQKEIISAAEVIGILQQHQVGLAIVAATPTRLALELKAQGGNRIIPIFSPYTHELGKRGWYKNTQLAQEFESGLQRKQFFGLGEVHFMAGFPPRLDNPVFIDLLRVAEKYQVPSLIHIDSADASLFIRLCRNHPRQKLIFAHAGGVLDAAAIRPVLQSCPLAWIDLAARDPWRYGGITNEGGGLVTSWRQLMLDYPEKFITGTDPVWKVTRTQSWDQADDGWQHYDRLFQFHQSWLAQLPAQVAEKIAWDNVLDIFNLQHRY